MQITLFIGELSFILHFMCPSNCLSAHFFELNKFSVYYNNIILMNKDTDILNKYTRSLLIYDQCNSNLTIN